MFYRFLYPIVTWLVRFLAHVTVIGAERLPRRGGVLVVANHLTNYDPLIIGVCFKRELHFMAKVELFDAPVISWAVRHLRAFPVRRDEADRTALREADRLLRAGRVVAIFPEGHRSRGTGVQESRGGIAMIGRRAHVPILPVGISGTEQLLPRALLRWRPWRRPDVRIVVGEPFRLPETAGRADYNGMARTIMAGVADLLPPAYRGVFGDGESTTEALNDA